MERTIRVLTLELVNLSERVFYGSEILTWHTYQTIENKLSMILNDGVITFGTITVYGQVIPVYKMVTADKPNAVWNRVESIG